MEKEDTIRDSQGGFQHITIMVERSIAKRVVKQPWKEETKAKKKEKILGKIVVVKDFKGFNPIGCHIKDTTIGEEYVNSFPLAFSPI